TPADGPTSPYFRRLSRFSAAFALVSDIALAVYGGSLKRRETASGRLADALAWLYLASATLKRFHDEGEPGRDLAVMRWSREAALAKIDEALRGVLDNLPSRTIARIAGWTIFGFGGHARGPGDRLSAEVARALMDDGELRRHLTTDIFIPPAQEEGLGRLEATLKKVVAAQPIKARLRESARRGGHGADLNGSLDAAVAAGVISEEERDTLLDAEAARLAAIQVDVFDPDIYRHLR